VAGKQPPWERKALEGFSDDVKALPDVNLRRMVLEMWVAVAKGELEGRALEDHPSVGDLSDCFKIYFDLPQFERPRFRFVYRFVGSAPQGVAVQAVAAGPRARMDVYVTAARRLGRFVDDEPGH